MVGTTIANARGTPTASSAGLEPELEWRTYSNGPTGVWASCSLLSARAPVTAWSTQASANMIRSGYVGLLGSRIVHRQSSATQGDPLPPSTHRSSTFTASGERKYRPTYSGLGFVRVESDVGCPVQDSFERAWDSTPRCIARQSGWGPVPNAMWAVAAREMLNASGSGAALVVVRGRDEDEDVLIGGDAGPGEVGVSCGLPCDHEEGSLPAQALFDCGTNQCPIVLESVGWSVCVRRPTRRLPRER